MNIVYGKVTLRAIEERDLTFCFGMINDPQIEISTVGKNFPVSIHQQREWFLNCSDARLIRLLIEAEDTGPIGMAMISDISWINRSAELGIKFSPTVSRTREDTENAANALLKYAFDELNLHSVYANIVEDNLFSRKLMMQFGFTEEGKLRDRVYKRGTYHNLMVYSLLRNEYARKCGATDSQQTE